MNQGFPSIEGLRAYMAWWVVLSHVLAFCGTLSWIPSAVVGWLAAGDRAVNVFIIASGFVITHLLITKPEPYRYYIVRRLFRIVPIYAVCMLLAILTASFYADAFVEPQWGWFSGSWRESKLEQARHWTAHLALHSTLLHGLVPEAILPFSASAILGPAWSLSLEWQFYLLAPLLIGFLSRNLRQFAAGALVLLALGWAAHHWVGHQYRYPSMLFLAIHWFLVGIGSRLAIDLVRGQPLRLAALFAAMALFVVLERSKEMLVWMIFFGFAMFETRDKTGDTRGMGALAAIVHLAASNRMVGTLGKVSYSTYLVHTSLFAIVVHFWGVSTQEQMFYALLVGMALLPFVSLALHKGVEAPFMAWGRRFVDGRHNRIIASRMQGSPGP